MAPRLQVSLLVLALLVVGSGWLVLARTHRTSAAATDGDVNCNGIVNAIDALLILREHAGLLDSRDCAKSMDVNYDGRVDSVDAELVLQYTAGLLPWLGTPPPTFTPPPPPTPTPTPPDSVMGVEFSMAIDVDGDGTDDCSTHDSGNDTCFVNEGVPFTINVRLDRLPANLPQYAGFVIVARYSGVEPIGEPDADVWPDCGFELIAPVIPGRLAFGCVIGVSEEEQRPLPPSSYTGIIGTAQFTSVCGQGSVSLLHGIWNTTITDESLMSHLEARVGEETLTIVCATP